MEILIFWILWTFIGGLIGAAKDQLVSGIFWGFFLGPIGIVVVLCLPNRKKQKLEEKRYRQVAFQLQRQQAQLHTREQMQQPDQMQHIPPPPGYEPKLRIASNGQDFGEMPLTTVKLMLKGGKLTQQDYYFDRSANDWMPLDCCPDLV